MKHLYVSNPVNTFHKNEKWQLLVFNCNDAVAQQINTCTQQMFVFIIMYIYMVYLPMRIDEKHIFKQPFC